MEKPLMEKHLCEMSLAELTREQQKAMTLPAPRAVPLRGTTLYRRKSMATLRGNINGIFAARQRRLPRSPRCVRAPHLPPPLGGGGTADPPRGRDGEGNQ